MASVDFEVRDFVGHITINNPEKRNAVDSAMAGQLAAAYDEVERRDDVRVVVISGAGGKSFCAGGNIPDYIGKVVGTGGSGQRTVLPKPWRLSPPPWVAGSPSPSLATSAWPGSPRSSVPLA
jgi:enoyl-CoA hydratase/carnithine racemase